jgi:hypothetical protein
MAPLIQSLSLRRALGVLFLIWFSHLVVAAPAVSLLKDGTMALEKRQIEKRQATSKLVFAHFLVSARSSLGEEG